MAGYDEPSLTAALGSASLGSLRPGDFPVYDRRIAEREPLANLIRVFLFGHEGRRSDLDAILGAQAVEVLGSNGLVSLQDDRIVPQVRITPFDGLIFAHDLEASTTITPEHVPGIGPAPRTLHALTIRTPVARALDIGTGCGVQALCLARHADHVIGTDVSPRALWLAQCNAALNGIENVEWREGSLLDPVAAESFDLVIANPPFVISPDTAYVFRDAGIDGNVSEALVSAVHRILRPGGYAQVLINWEVGEGSDWQAEPQRWVEGTGCDAWLLHYQSEDGLSYAAKWNTWLRDADSEAFGAALDRWTDYYAKRGVAALATGAITLRRRTAEPVWWRSDRMRTGPEGDGGKQVLQVFKSQSQLQRIRDSSDLRALVPDFTGNHRLDQRMRYRNGAYVVETTHLLLDDNAGVAGTVDPQALLVVLAIDGHQTVGDLLMDAAEGLPEQESEALEQAVFRTLCHLAEVGIVTLGSAYCNSPPDT